jgi:putative salt-induced outer membrane protein YdiY
MCRFYYVIFLTLLVSALGYADQVVLKNGDRLTGSITRSDTDDLTLKTDYADEVIIQWSAIQEINSSQSLHLTTQDGKTIAGPITSSDGQLVIATSGGKLEIPKDQITGLRNDEEQAAYEQSLHPPVTKGWAGGTTVGFALTHGNSETKNLNLAFNADRKTLHDDTIAYMNTVYATNDAPGAFPSVTANTIQAGARYAHDLKKPLFAFGTADFQTDQLQTLDLRSVFGGGLGVHVISTANTTLDLIAGLNYTREKYGSGGLTPGTGFTRNFPALIIGEEFMHRIGDSTVLTEKAYVFPNLDPVGDYRVTLNVGSTTKLSKWLAWQNAFGDIYVTNPPSAKKRTDLLLTTGLNLTFMR